MDRIRLGSIAEGGIGPEGAVLWVPVLLLGEALEEEDADPCKFGVTRTTTGMCSVCSSSGFALLFLAVAVDKRTRRGIRSSLNRAKSYVLGRDLQ